MRVDDHRLDGSAPSARAVPTLGTVEKARGARGGALELDLWAPASRGFARSPEYAATRADGARDVHGDEETGEEAL